MLGTVVSSRGGGFKVAYDGEELKNSVLCGARGILRKNGQSPLCGDRVETEISAGEHIITKILPRKNELIRPPLANLDQILFVCSSVSPPPNILNLDKFTAVSVYKNILPVIVLTKTDLCDPERYVKIYSDIFPTFTVNNITGEGVDELKNVLKDKFSAMCGSSGVGKSSLLNNLVPGTDAEIGEISKKLQRGKNTTRRTDIYSLPDGGYIADTPGFAAFSTERYGTIFKNLLADCFPEFSKFIGHCRYSDCSHRTERGCAVLEAVNNGLIHPSRHKSYLAMYRESENISRNVQSSKLEIRKQTVRNQKK